MANPIIPPPSGVPMRDFIEMRGWVYMGSCNCANQMSRFRNPAISDKEVWMDGAGSRMEIRRIFTAMNDRDSKILALAGKMNFEHIYNMFLA